MSEGGSFLWGQLFDAGKSLGAKKVECRADKIIDGKIGFKEWA
jgi:hypothetical protein